MNVPNRTRRWLIASFSLALLFAFTSAASAHEGREVGEYELTVGFSEEPALVNEPNGLYLLIHRAGNESAVLEGLQETLQAEISYAGETMPLDISPSFRQPGNYTADIFPTAEGTYTFRIFGTIEGTEIDESFTSGPETFSDIESVEAIAIPAVAGDGSAAASDAQDTANSARTLAIVGIIAGVLGLAAGAAGVMMAMTARSARTGIATQDATD